MRETFGPSITGTSRGLHWRHLLLGIVVAGSFVLMFSQAPFPQDQNYHAFADSRGFLGIPNFGDVASNLGFLVVGIAGLIVCFGEPLGEMKSGWIVMFAGIAAVGVASSYYHWAPTDQSLVADRMTLTIGFMGLFIAILGEYVSTRFRFLLWPAVLIGAGSVLYWHWFQDLRLYYWIQLVPLLSLPFIMMLYPAKYSHAWLIFAGALWYGLAKLAELFDKSIFAATQGSISGHTIKHILAAVGCASILAALYYRKDLK